MKTWDILLALLLPLPLWVGFLVYRARGRVGLSYGYFLGSVLCLLALPWPQLGPRPVPSAQLGGILFGCALFVGAYREGRHGLRRLILGIGGGSIFSLLMLASQGLPLRSLGLFWIGALVQAIGMLALSDLGYRATRGRWLHLRLPGAALLALALTSLILRRVHPALPPLSWAATLISGPLLGLVVLQHLLYMRSHGSWVEGRGNGFKTALAALERHPRPDGPSFGWTVEARQPILLVNERGQLLEGNTAFGRLIGLPRHLLRGYDLEAFLQGGEQSVWEDLRSQLFRQDRARTAAALVRRDGGFEPVELEAAPFDRNLALVWVTSPHPGALALHEPRDHPGIQDPPEEALSAPRQAVNALGTIVPAAEQILAESTTPRVREAAELILVAAHRLVPEARRGDSPVLSLQAFVKEQMGRLNRMMPREIRVTGDAGPIGLATDPEALARILTHLALHARQALRTGIIHIQATPRLVGGRPWATLTLHLHGERHRKGPQLLGLGWLLEAVRATRGTLELWRDGQGNVWPRVWLPQPGTETQAPEQPLAGLNLWIADQDPLVREALDHLAAREGATVETFPDLRAMLRASRSRQAPDLLVMERTETLERFRRIFHHLQLVPVPMLLLGSGASLGESDPIALHHGRVAFLEKPFPRQAFLQSLQLLLNPLPDLT